MNPKEIVGLAEAYLEVYREIGEAMMDGPRKDRMVKKQYDQYATSRDRATAFNVGARDERPRDKESTGGKGKRYSDFGDRGFGNANRRRRGLKPLRGDTRPTQAEQVDLYDIILSHLLDEGYADTEEAAERIMVNMSEDWRESIVEAKMPLNKEKVKKQIEKKVASDKPKDWYNAGRMMGHTGVKAEETTTEPDPFGRPGGKYGGVKKGGGYDRGNDAVKKKIAELDSKKKS